MHKREKEISKEVKTGIAKLLQDMQEESERVFDFAPSVHVEIEGWIAELRKLQIELGATDKVHTFRG